MKLHELRRGDIICAIGRVELDSSISDCLLGLRLNATAGGAITLGLVRDRIRKDAVVRTHRQPYRAAALPGAIQ